MNKKVLIVAEAREFRSVMRRALASRFEEGVIAVSHDEALVKFLEEEPQVVIVWDYVDRRGIYKSAGYVTYDDIKSAASSEQKVIRIGFDTYDYPDYIRAPFKLAELFEKIS